MCMDTNKRDCVQTRITLLWTDTYDWFMKCLILLIPACYEEPNVCQTKSMFAQDQVLHLVLGGQRWGRHQHEQLEALQEPALEKPPRLPSPSRLGFVGGCWWVHSTVWHKNTLAPATHQHVKATLTWPPASDKPSYPNLAKKKKNWGVQRLIQRV